MNLHRSIDPAILAAVAPFMGKKDVRFYLNGIHLEFNEQGTTAIATDGEALAVCRDETAATPERVSFTVDRDTVLAVLKMIQPATARLLFIEHSDDSPGFVTFKTPAGSLTRPLVDGRYPDWRRVIPPGAVSGDEPAVNPELLKRFIDAAAALKKWTECKHMPSMRMVGNDVERCMPITFGHLRHDLYFGGVLMPLRNVEKVDRTTFCDAMRA